MIKTKHIKTDYRTILKSTPDWPPNNQRKKISGHYVKTASGRLVAFKRQFLEYGEVYCVSCGKKATHFQIEKKQRDRCFHLQLYAGKDILTKDHILPVSKGGKNHPDNYQTMCYPCNQRKGNESNEVLRHRIRNKTL